MMLFNQQQQQADESMSNLTTASGEASGSSGGNKPPEFPYNFTSPSLQQQQPQIPQQPPNKKKRNLPGNPDPEAEVVALSPKTLMATNRFVCEVCKKGFQRDQNLQLHRRGHNLPWKLKQRPGGKDAPPPRKKVYVCPEVGCVHHDPARALGDLTGIKKHFSRKHGDKRWKCDKCSKRYAVHSDFKAHSKTCGTREYRCDCGTIFSRRDSFITHRAFCDALAEESARAIVTNHGNAAVVPMPVQSAIHRHHFNQLLNNNNNNNSNNNNMQMLVDHHHHHHHQANNANNSMSSSSSSVLMMKKEEQQQQQQNGFGSSSSSSNSHLLIPPWLAGPNHPPSHFDHHHQSNNNNVNSNSNQHLFSSLQDFSAEEHDFSPNPNPNPNRLPPFQPPVMSAHMSATALLQKAAQIGATMSSDEPPSISSPAPRADGINDHVLFPAKKHREISAGVSTGNNNGVDHHNHHQAGLTRDFLGLRALSHSDILSLAGLGNTINISHQEHQNNQQTLHKPW